MGFKSFAVGRSLDDWHNDLVDEVKDLRVKVSLNEPVAGTRSKTDAVECKGDYDQLHSNEELAGCEKKLKFRQICVQNSKSLDDLNGKDYCIHEKSEEIKKNNKDISSNNSESAYRVKLRHRPTAQNLAF